MCFFEPTKSKYLYLTVSNMFHANSNIEQAAKSWIEFNFESPFNFVFIPFYEFCMIGNFSCNVDPAPKGRRVHVWIDWRWKSR